MVFRQNAFPILNIPLELEFDLGLDLTFGKSPAPNTAIKKRRKRGTRLTTSG